MSVTKNPLTDHERSFISVLVRSPDQGDGWRNVSRVVAPIATKMADERPELFEWDATSEPARIRLTERGNILKDYL